MFAIFTIPPVLLIPLIVFNKVVVEHEVDNCLPTESEQVIDNREQKVGPVATSHGSTDDEKQVDNECIEPRDQTEPDRALVEVSLIFWLMNERDAPHDEGGNIDCLMANAHTPPSTLCYRVADCPACV